MNNPNILDTIGTALTFPLKLDEQGRVLLSNGWEVINASLRNLIVFGPRYFLYQFGVGIEKYFQDPNDPVLANLLEYHISQQLDMFDRRVRIDSIEVSRTNNDNTLNVAIKVKLAGTNQEDTFIYPFSTETIY